MVIFASFDSLPDVDKEFKGIKDRISFASLGQSIAGCRRSPNTEKSTSVTFIFECSNHYEITELRDAGIIWYDDYAPTEEYKLN